jgi:hypothetical protein
MHLYMLGTRKEWAALTAKVTGPLAGKYLSIEAGGYCHAGVCVFWDIGNLATLSVASHEGLHQFFHHRLKDRLPAWMEEGLCSTAEGYEIQGRAVRFTPDRNVLRFNHLRSLISGGRWVALAELLPMDAGDIAGRPTEHAVGYYGQLWALALFIRSQPAYRAGMQRLMADAEQGTLHQALNLAPAELAAMRMRPKQYNQAVSVAMFRHYVSGDLEGFESNFKAYARRLAGY